MGMGNQLKKIFGRMVHGSSMISMYPTASDSIVILSPEERGVQSWNRTGLVLRRTMNSYAAKIR